MSDGRPSDPASPSHARDRGTNADFQLVIGIEKGLSRNLGDDGLTSLVGSPLG
jgi:hypothetical protein